VVSDAPALASNLYITRCSTLARNLLDQYAAAQSRMRTEAGWYDEFYMGELVTAPADVAGLVTDRHDGYEYMQFLFDRGILFANVETLAEYWRALAFYPGGDGTWTLVERDSGGTQLQTAGVVDVRTELVMQYVQYVAAAQTEYYSLYGQYGSSAELSANWQRPLVDGRLAYSPAQLGFNIMLGLDVTDDEQDYVIEAGFGAMWWQRTADGTITPIAPPEWAEE
jgi:hypothetical protein